MSNNIDLTNLRFGRWLVIEYVKADKHGSIWKCRCDCGNEKNIYLANLKNGTSQSCGCLRNEKIKERRFIDLTGKKFNRLFVKGLAYKKGLIYYWECICDCGTEKIINGSKLRTGNTQSCGCWNREKGFKDFGEATFNQVLAQYKINAKNRNLSFELTNEEFKYIIGQNCYYCGCEPNQIIKSNSNNGDCIYNGIDRIDNLKGYTEDNIVPCCGKCNQGKTNMSESDFLNWIEKIYNYSIIK
jgi:hypothetical protein